jgi:hypothetical protein
MPWCCGWFGWFFFVWGLAEKKKKKYLYYVEIIRKAAFKSLREEDLCPSNIGGGAVAFGTGAK